MIKIDPKDSKHEIGKWLCWIGKEVRVHVHNPSYLYTYPTLHFSITFLHLYSLNQEAIHNIMNKHQENKHLILSYFIYSHAYTTSYLEH